MGKRRSRGLAGLIAIGVVVLGVGIGTALAQPSAGPAGWPIAKAQLWEREQAELAQARSHPRPKLPSAGLAPAVEALPPRQAGIIAMRQGPFPPTQFLVRAVWQGPVGSAWVLVYAGATRGAAASAPPSEGALRLFQESSTMHLTPIGTFSAPDGTGPLTITAASGNRLQLTTDGGTSLSFDLVTRQFR